MKRISHWLNVAVATLIAMNLFSSVTLADDLSKLAESSDAEQASKLVKKLQADPNLRLLPVLEAMKGKDEVTKNWLLSVAQTVADRDPSGSSAQLEQFLPRLSEDPNARYWAFRYLTQGDEQKREMLLASMLADPSLELRYEAVGLGFAKTKDAENLNETQKVRSFQELLNAARLPSQIQSIAKELEDLGQEIDLLQHFGFVSQWQVLGTFDNVDQVGFDIDYAPEKMYAAGELTEAASFDGKQGKTSWQMVTTSEPDGAIDLAKAWNAEKGAVAYALGQFQSPGDLQCQVRIGSPNATKVWVNGALVIAREVYHSGNQIDQYVAPVKLRRGDNSILVKSCQNEQKQPWAQDWAFQLRFTDETGYAIQPAK